MFGDILKVFLASLCLTCTTKLVRKKKSGVDFRVTFSSRIAQTFMIPTIYYHCMIYCLCHTLQIASVHQVSCMYSAEMVCSLLDNSGTDSAASSGDEMSSSGTDYDLSDPEAGMWQDPCHIEAEIYEHFMTDDLVATDTIDSIISTTNVYGEEFTSGTAMDTGECDVTNNDTVNNFGTPTGTVETQSPVLCTRRGRSTSRRGRSTSRCGRSASRHGRSANRRGKSARNKAHSNGDTEPLDVKNICAKTNIVEIVHPFVPVRPSGIYIPDEIDSKKPEQLFKLFFDSNRRLYLQIKQ